MDEGKRLVLLGVRVDALTIVDLNSAIEDAIRDGRSLIVANHNLNSVALYHRDPGMRHFFGLADVTHIDGMPLVYWARLLGHPLGVQHRVTYVDWIRPLIAHAARSRWRVFLLGGAPGVAERAAAVLTVGGQPEIACHHGFFDPAPDSASNRAVIAAIRSWKTQLLLVGMGMPRQEKWIAENRPSLPPCAVLPAGGCFDYLAGEVPTPPRWAGPMGLEWAFRLAAEPRRLMKRYLIEPWQLIPHAARDLRAIVARRRKDTNA